jgi:hypothetical protein
VAGLSRARATVSQPIPDTYRTRRLRTPTNCQAGSTDQGRRLLWSQLMGPSRVVAFPLVGFGADVVSGSSPSTIAISSSPWW